MFLKLLKIKCIKKLNTNFTLIFILILNTNNYININHIKEIVSYLTNENVARVHCFSLPFIKWLLIDNRIIVVLIDY